MLCSHYHDSRHDWIRGLNRGVIMVILSYLEVSCGNLVDRRIILDGSKFSTINTINCQSWSSHQILTKCDRSHLIVLLNRGDRDQPWTRPTPGFVWMCCNLPRSVTICGPLSIVTIVLIVVKFWTVQKFSTISYEWLIVLFVTDRTTVGT